MNIKRYDTLNNIFTLVAILVVLVVIGVNRTSAQERLPYFCSHTDGTFYQENITPHYALAANRLRLLDWTTGEETMVLESTPDMVNGFFATHWTQDCRYLVGLMAVNLNNLTYEVPDYAFMLWDTQSGALLQRYDVAKDIVGTSYNGDENIAFSPNSQYMIFRTSDGYFLWNAENNSNTLLINASIDRAPNLSHTHWDFARNQVIIKGNPGVIAYDLGSGYERFLFTSTPENAQDTDFVMSADQSKMAVFTDQTSSDRRYTSLSIWDLNSMQVTELNVEDGIYYVAYHGHRYGFSADNRFFIIRGTALRIWDLANLPTEVDNRLPLHRIPIGWNFTWEFIDSDTINVHWGSSTGVLSTYYHLATGVEEWRSY